MATFELRIPPNFFDSAKADNNFESVSERIAKTFSFGDYEHFPFDAW